MRPPATVPSEKTLTISIVLCRSPVTELRALIDSLIVALSSATVAKVSCVLVDHSEDQAYTAQYQAMLGEYAACPLISIDLLVPDGNAGYGAGHNLAVATLEGQFHLILNPDVELPKHAISVALDVMTAQGDLVLLAPVGFGSCQQPLYLAKAFPSVWALALRAFAPLWLRRRSRAVTRYELRDQPSEIVRQVPLVSGCCMWVRRAVYDEIGGFDDSFFLYFEDFDLSMRMARHGTVIEHRGVTIIHHGGKASRKGWRHLLWFSVSATRFFNRWGWKWLG